MINLTQFSRDCSRDVAMVTDIWRELAKNWHTPPSLCALAFIWNIVTRMHALTPPNDPSTSDINTVNFSSVTLKICRQRNFVVDFFSTEVQFYWQKQQNRVLCHPLGDLGGNVHGSSMAHLWIDS